ncbi:MAG TPA: EamA family transporter [Pirellulales bacterium]|nr:EamA family transporter [Pirellulales bacterium]
MSANRPEPAALPLAAAEAGQEHPLVGRLSVLAATLFWSTNGIFAKADIFADWPADSRGTLLAFWRAAFAGSLLVTLVRQPKWNARLVPMALAFTGMNLAFLKSLTMTTAANAIWLQSTSPLWAFCYGLVLRHDRFDRRDAWPLVCGLIGTATILGCELTESVSPAQRAGVLAGLISGILYAVVVVSIRRLRGLDTAWLVAVNHLSAALLLAPYCLATGPWPSTRQLVVLALFGCLQMGIPYFLFARGLRYITSQEAVGIGLLEPVLAPLWVYLIYGEQPAWWTLAGGGLILSGLVARYSLLTKR